MVMQSNNEDNDIEPDMEEHEEEDYVIYTQTDAANWKERKGRARGWTVEPIP